MRLFELRKCMAFALSLLTVAALLSCQSSPRKHYYLLNSAAGVSASSGSTTGNQHTSTPITRSIGIGPIVIADYLDRLAIVRTQGDNSLQISDTDYWGEPLDKGIARVLADTLRQHNPATSFVQFPYRSDARPSHSLRLQIHQLNYNGSQASLEATWELVDNTTKQIISRKNFFHTSTTAGNPTDIARAYSNLLATLADDLQPELQHLTSTSP